MYETHYPKKAKYGFWAYFLDFTNVRSTKTSLNYSNKNTLFCDSINKFRGLRADKIGNAGEYHGRCLIQECVTLSNHITYLCLAAP